LPCASVRRPDGRRSGARPWCGPRPVHVVVARRAAGPVILPWHAPPVRELPMRYCKAHATLCHPRQSLEIIELEGSSAMPQHGGPAPCHQGRADRLSVDSRLARAAAPHQTPPPSVQGRTQQRVSNPRSRAALSARAAPWARRGCQRVRWRLQGAAPRHWRQSAFGLPIRRYDSIAAAGNAAHAGLLIQHCVWRHTSGKCSWHGHCTWGRLLHH
jgi:hypothetical protein